MTLTERYEAAKARYAAIGVDTDEAVKKVKKFPVSLHCWQGDDVRGFDQDGPLTGGIQVNGNYPGRAKNPKELMEDLEEVLKLIPGTKRLNLHASYAVFEDGETADRDALEPKHFKAWVEFAKKHDLALDFNPTYFSHPLAADNQTLTSEKEEVRKFWIRHGQACIRISQYFAEELGSPCLMNIWIPDGMKNTPADRMRARKRYKESLDEILSIPYDKSKVLVSLESKVFGIGLESYTAGSAEFCMNYAAQKGILCLMDDGHYHPTELVSDKISSMLLFHDQIALHITHSVRWDSDHVLLLDDELKEIAKEIVANDAMERVHMGVDYFDASINRIGAWAIGMRNAQKAMLYALLQPHDTMKELQKTENITELMALQERLKVYPFGDVWDYYCSCEQTPLEDEYMSEVKRYERDVLNKRSEG